MGVTNNTKESWGDVYCPNATSVAGWGGNESWLPYGALTTQPEFPWYTAGKPENWMLLDPTVSTNMYQTGYTTTGINGKYLWENLLFPYYTGGDL